MPFGYRSLHALELGVPGDVFPPPEDSPATTQNNPQQPRTYAQATTPKPFSLPLQKSIDAGKKEEMQLTKGAQHGQAPVVTTLAKPRGNSLVSLETVKNSIGPITPPGSPKPQPKLSLLTNGEGFTTVRNKKKRSRNGIDFSNLMVRDQPSQPLDGIATSNYFQALQTMEVAFEAKDVTADAKFGPRYQILPTEVKRPEALKTSTDTAFFVEKHHTKVRKASKASSLAEVAESMLNDENTALLSILPDCLATADTKVVSVLNIVENATNHGHVAKKAMESPLAFDSVLSLKMAGSGRETAEIAQLHAINRAMCASKPSKDTTFSTKWRKLMKTTVPSKREELSKTCAKWWRSSDQVNELSRAAKALGIFELMLISIAPTIFSNDHWIQYITGQPVEWIPAHHTSLLL